MERTNRFVRVGFVGFLAVLGVVLGGPTEALADTLPHEDGGFPCLSASEAERYVRDFNINVSSFGGEELCDSAVDTRKLLSDLYLIENGRFLATGKNVFDGGFVDIDSYYDWSRSMTRGVRRGHDIPYATAYNSGGYFTMQDGWAALSTLGRVGTFIHEARHTGGYYHIRCTNGPYTNSSVRGCDRSVSYGGSHGVEMEYYARVVVRGENFHPVYKTMARLMAIGRGNWVFNQPAISRREALVAVEDNSGQPMMVDGGQVLERVGPPVGNGVLKRTSFGASYFYGTHARALDLYSTGQADATIQDDYSYFKLLNGSRDQLPGMRDLEEFDLGVDRFLVALTDDGRLYRYVFPQGRWSNTATAAIPNADRLITVAPNGQTGIFVLTTTGRVVEYDVRNHRLGGELRATWEEDVVSYASVSGMTMKLTESGLVWFAQDGQWIPYPELAGYKINQMQTVPLYDAFEVNP